MTTDLNRALGHLEGTVEGLGERLDNVEAKIDVNSKKIGEMHDVFMQAQGGLRLIVMCSSVSGAIGAVIAWAISLWRGH